LGTLMPLLRNYLAERYYKS